MVWGADEELSAKFDSDEESVLGRADGELSKEFDLEEEYVLGRGERVSNMPGRIGEGMV